MSGQVDSLQQEKECSETDAACECDVYDKLEEVVASPGFLLTIDRARVGDGCASGNRSTQLVHMGGRPLDTRAPILGFNEEHFQTSSDGLSQQTDSSESALAVAQALAAGMTPEGYVMVDKDDAVGALAWYIATVLAKLPEAQALPPAELQKALILTLQGLRKTRIKQVWNWGRFVYRWTAMSYSAVQMFQNPWLVQAVLTALWACSRTLIRVLA